MDVWTYRLAVAGLCLCALVCLVGSTALAVCGRETPTSLATVAGVCVGAVAGILSDGPKDGRR